MARKATGAVIPPEGKQRSWAIRFTADGRRRYVTLGRPEDGWNRQRAEAELDRTLAQVKLGQWQPASKVEAKPADDPTFHEFASEWLRVREPELRPKTVKDYRWALSYQLLPFFANHRLLEISAEEVDRYKAEKLGEGKLAPNAINKTITRLAQILEVAEEYGHIARNPARGKRRRVKGTKPRRSWVEPEQVMVLLDSAPPGHRPILATLAGAGLRIGEATALDWRDINLATGTLTVQESKTDAGQGRTIDLPLGLADELRVHRAAVGNPRPDDPVFLSRARNGNRSRQSPDNVGRRLKTAIRDANKRLVELGIEPISERVSPHSLRRTYASLRAALHDDPTYIADQLGHEDPTFAISVYAKAVKRRERLSDEYREAFDRALEWAEIGRIDAEAPERVERVGAAEAANPAP